MIRDVLSVIKTRQSEKHQKRPVADPGIAGGGYDLCWGGAEGLWNGEGDTHPLPLPTRGSGGASPRGVRGGVPA